MLAMYVSKRQRCGSQFTRMGSLAEGDNIGNKDEDHNLLSSSQPIGLLGNLNSYGVIHPIIL